MMSTITLNVNEQNRSIKGKKIPDNKEKQYTIIFFHETHFKYKNTVRLPVE